MLISCTGTFSNIERDKDHTPARNYALTGDIKAEVDSLAKPLIEKDKTPGLVVGVLLPDGRKTFFGYGVTEKDNGSRPDENTLFAIGSTSKAFSGAAASIMVQEGELSWNNTLGELLPANISLSADAQNISLLQLATHTSGLPRQPLTLRTSMYFIQYLFTGRSFYRHFDKDYLMKYLADFKAPRDIQPQYSNIGFGILGYVLSLQAETPLEDLVQKKVLDPLGLTGTGYDPIQLPGYENRAIGYAGDQPKFIRRGKKAPDWEFTDIMLGSGGLYSTAGDMLSFARAHLYPCDEQTLKSALQETLKVRIKGPHASRGIAWAVDIDNDCKIIYQIGFVGGYSSYIGMNEDNRTAVVVLQNSFNWTESIGHRLLQRMAYAHQ